MKQEDALFALIQCLSQHEKRYVGLQLRRHASHKESHLLRLYQLLERQPSYDEAAVKRVLAGDALGRQYAVYKNLLYQALLRALQAYAYERSPGMKVRSGIDKVELLTEKGRHAAALKLLERTRGIAIESGQSKYLLEILDWERRLVRYLSPLTYREQLSQMAAQQSQILQQLKEEESAVGIYDALFALVQVERRMEKKELGDQLSALSAQLTAAMAQPATSFNVQAAILNAQALLAQLQGNYLAMLGAYAALVQHWEAHPAMQAHEPKRFARVRIAWLNSALAAGQIGTYLQQIRALRKIPIAGNADNARTIFQSYNLELLWLMDKNELPAAIQFLAAFEQKLPEIRAHLDEVRLSTFFLNAAILHFRNRNYHNSLAWLNRLILTKSQHRETTFFRTASLLALICNCQIGNLNAAENLLQSMQRRQKGRDADWEFGALVTQWMRLILAVWGLPACAVQKRAFHATLVELEATAQPAPLAIDLIRQWAGAH